MSQNNCCDDNYNGRIVLQPVTNISTTLDIDIVGVSPINVVKSMRGTTTVFTVSLHIPSPPTASLSVNPSVVEFNKPFTATYTGSYLKGSETLVAELLVPIPVPVVSTATSPFTFTVSDTPQQVGSHYTYTLNVLDTANQSASASASINVQYRYYRGLIPRNVILTSSSATLFESGLGDSITSVFGVKRHYINAIGSDAHFAWLMPVDSPAMGTPLGDGNFPFETQIEPYTITLNGVQYRVVKTINFYPTSTDVQLTF